MDGDTTERLSQESQCPDAKEHGLLARASAFAGGAVSYTHLRKEELYQLTFDENDRVSFNALWALTHFDEANNPWPVSYTHLDVYKRQTGLEQVGISIVV